MIKKKPHHVITAEEEVTVSRGSLLRISDSFWGRYYNKKLFYLLVPFCHLFDEGASQSS